MRKSVILPLILAFFLNTACAQDEKLVAGIEAEGKRLYRSEMASWYGTDLFQQVFPHRMYEFGGYFSYPSGGRTRIVFVSNGDRPDILAAIDLDSTFNPQTAAIDSNRRPLSAGEQQLLTLRQKTLLALSKDTLFRQYDNTNFNIIPLADDGGRRVYVLTGTSSSGVVLLGNDYLLTFSNNNELVHATALHRNLIPIEYGKQKSEATIHNHLGATDAYITPTDICTLLLYRRLTGWKQHYVMSEKFVSIFQIDKALLVVMTREAFSRIGEDAKKRPAGDQ